YTQRWCHPQPYIVVSDEQIIGEDVMSFQSATDGPMDLYIRDQCRDMGLMNGGIHGGEPLVDRLLHQGASPQIGSQVNIAGNPLPLNIALNKETGRQAGNMGAGGNGADGGFS